MSSVCLIIIALFARTTLSLYAGDDCILRATNETARCVSIHYCPKAVEDLKKQIIPQSCGFDKSTPIVCCEEQKLRTKCVRKCEQYSKEAELVENEFYPSVVGGLPSRKGQFPHMAALGYKDGDLISWQCGGTLISENIVLTAAHCLQSPEKGPVSWVRLGEIVLEATTKFDPNLDYKVIKSIAHHQYKPPAAYHDIALLKLDKNVTWSFTIKPACLHNTYRIDKKETGGLQVTGWGLTEYNGDRSVALLHANVDEFSKVECETNYKSLLNSRKLKTGIDHSSQLCAGGRDVEKDTCQGDSGGPLQIKKFSDPLYSVVGVTSFGKGCGTKNIPGVYVRVSNYIAWIELIVWSGVDLFV